MCGSNAGRTGITGNTCGIDDWGFEPLIEVLEQRFLLSGTHYVVDSLLDVVADDGVVTLREAIEAANTNTAVTGDVAAGSGDDADVITFDQAALSAEAGVDVGQPLTIMLDGSELIIEDDLQIQGLGQNILTIDADGRSGVFNLRGYEANVELSHLKITGSYSDGDHGGIYIRVGIITISHCMVSSNLNSGIYVEAGQITIDNSIISDNYANAGGGIYNYHGYVTVTDSVIANNTASRGGGVYNEMDKYKYYNSDNELVLYYGVLLTDTTVVNNYATFYGGGIYNSAEEGVAIIHSTVSNNSAQESGGGIYNSTTYYNSSFYMIDSFLAGNSAKTGGGVFNTSSYSTMTNSVVVGNSADNGGGIYAFRSMTIRNCTVVSNWAMEAGGGIYVRDNSSVNLKNTIVAFNKANDGDQINNEFSEGGNLIGINPGFVRNPDDGGDGWVDDPDTADIDESANNDYGDLHLSIASIAINSGDNTFTTFYIEEQLVTLIADKDSNPRIIDGQVDVGAYEYQETVSGIRETPSSVVTTLDDIVDTMDGQISLREAIVYENILQEIITFAPELAGGTMLLDGSAIHIYQGLTIDGTTVGGITIDAQGLSRVFYITDSNDDIELGGLIITGGYSTGNGGGIFNSHDYILILTNCVVVGNTTALNGGGIYNEFGAVLINCTVAGNYAKDSGGAMYSELTNILYNSIVANNDAKKNSNLFGGLAGSRNLIGIDPEFVRNPDHGGDGWVDNPETVDIDESANNDLGDLHLLDTSMAINYGDSTWAVDNLGIILTSDIDGHVRIINDAIDAGAYEFQSSNIPLREDPSVIVTTLDDVLDVTDGLISLREAIAYEGLLQQTITFASDLAGGIILLDGSEISIAQSLTIDATSVGGITIDAGGASRVIQTAGSEVELIGLTITGGYTTSYGGGIFNSAQRLVLTNCIVTGNSADHSGGGIYNDEKHHRTVIIVNSVISGNKTNEDGGGIYGGHRWMSLTHCTVNDNSAYRDGGGIYQEGGRITMTNSIVVGNIANRNGGGIGIYNYCTVILTNITVAGNSADSRGGGIFNERDSTALNNSIVAMNRADTDTDIDSHVIFTNSLIGVDPQFVRNPSAGVDGIWGTADDVAGDYHLLSGSPAIDAGLYEDGVPIADFDGHERYDDPFVDDTGSGAISYVDIGAYEASFFMAVPNADFNGDRVVGLLDLTILGEHYNRDGYASKSQGDANLDGMVDLLDLVTLGEQYSYARMVVEEQGDGGERGGLAEATEHTLSREVGIKMWHPEYASWGLEDGEEDEGVWGSLGLLEGMEVAV